MIGVLDRTDEGVLLVSVLVFVALGAATGTAAAQSAPDCSTVTYDGEGTEANPYEVGNVDQLQCIEEQDLDDSYVQVADIDASGTSEWNGGDGFDPIGEFNRNRDTEFTGTFDGANHTISGLTIDRGSTKQVGLFGFVDSYSGILENVSLKNVDIIGDDGVGGLVGENLGTVRESYATGDVSGDCGVGGLIGYNEDTVKESYATGDISGDCGAVGGLVGDNDGTVKESYATGNVSGASYVGGLTGGNRGTVERSYATGTVSGDSDVGGLVGFNEEVSLGEGAISESYAMGTVSGDSDVGGLVGYNDEGTISESYANGSVDGFRALGGLVGTNEGTVRESYATGSVNGSRHAGGLVGDNSGGNFVGEDSGGYINQSYATGAVSISDVEEGVSRNEGGLVGRNEISNSKGTITGSYWDTRTTGQTTSPGGGTGLNTSQMTGSAARGNMTGFDFTSAWEVVSNPDDYPIPTREGDGIVINSGDESEMNNDGEDGSLPPIEENAPTGDDTESEGLPGFTVVTAVLAHLTIVAAAIRRKRE